MQIERPSGYGLAERNCIGVNKKETTWCVALVELCSRIKYSSVSFIRRAVARMARRTKPTATATRTSSTWNGTRMAFGTATATGRSPRGSGAPAIRSSCVSESTFFPRLHGAVFLFGICQTSFPSAEHFADLLQFESNILALLVRNEFSFPNGGDQKFEKV